MESIIINNNKEFDRKNVQISANLNVLDEKIEIFASQLLKTVQSQSDDLIDKNVAYESIMNDFKQSIRQEFNVFEQIGKESLEKTITTLDELQKLNSINRKIQEETLMSQVFQIKKSSENIIRMIESIENDFQKAHASNCK